MKLVGHMNVIIYNTLMFDWYSQVFHTPHTP